MRTFRMVAVVVLAAALGGCGYNRIQQLDETAEQQRANIETELMARNQLIPNMVATVEGAAEFERGTFTEVAQARAGLEGRGSRWSRRWSPATWSQMQTADAQLTRQIGTYINIAVEAYPQLRATQNFQALQDQLAESENRIAVARRDYNEAVARYNTYVRQFPQAITARIVGAGRKEPYRAPPGADETPTVDFNRGG
jgi:LemA protein